MAGTAPADFGSTTTFNAGRSIGRFVGLPPDGRNACEQADGAAAAKDDPQTGLGADGADSSLRGLRVREPHQPANLSVLPSGSLRIS